MKMKKLAVAFLAGALTVGSAMTASAAWVPSGSEWRYQNEDNSWQAGKWFQDAGKWYHFDENGIMRKGWFKDVDGKWYFLAYHGAMQTGLIQVDNKVYFMNADGSLFVGAMKISGVEYNFTENGTTNGKPSVGTAQTWGGNGNQSSLTGGGGSSSGGGSGSSRPTESQAKVEAKKAVEDIFKDVFNTSSADEIVEEAKVVDQTIKFTYKNEASKNTLVKDTALLEEVGYALMEVLESGKVDKVMIGTKEYTKDNFDDFVSHAGLLGYTDKTVEEVIDALNGDQKITVFVGDEKIPYSVSAK